MTQTLVADKSPIISTQHVGSIDPRTRAGFRLTTILVPTDFSECSQIAFEYGRQLARDFNAELRLVPGVQICNAANQGVDLIVISTHGQTGLGHILIGSVAEHVVRYAHCPVLVIPSRPFRTRLNSLS